MTPIQIARGAVLIPGGLRHRAVTVIDDTITAVDEFDRAMPVVIDATGLIVAPGYVDLQINGEFGCDFVSDPTGIWQVGSRLVSHGVTAFLPTIITSPAGARGPTHPSIWSSRAWP